MKRTSKNVKKPFTSLGSCSLPPPSKLLLLRQWLSNCWPGNLDAANSVDSHSLKHGWHLPLSQQGCPHINASKPGSRLLKELSLGFTGLILRGGPCKHVCFPGGTFPSSGCRKRLTRGPPGQRGTSSQDSDHPHPSPAAHRTQI